VTLGGFIITNFPRIFTFVLGIGIASIGVLILIFLLKFITKSHKIDRTNLVEIKSKDHPKIFDLVNSIVSEVGTKLPKKIYLSHDINAAVFYDSSFWSMFFPVRKNLVIGMGLINSISSLELKAILSHEFGHFSQKSMKVGSYVYNVNQVIFNMIFENESYDRLIERWASFNRYFSIFVIIAVKIISGIQWILSKMYNVVNLSYLSLSREMEFHADEIAANITGSKPLKDSLLRMNLSEFAYNTVLNYYESKIPEKLRSANIYREQEFVMNYIAKDRKLPIENSLPIVSLEEINQYNKSKLEIKDQWSSHPTVEQRLDKLNGLNLNNSNNRTELAITEFNDIIKVQEKLTENLFSTIVYDGEVSVLNIDNFIKAYTEEYENSSFDDIFNGYYDNKSPLEFDFETISKSDIGADELFSEDKIHQVYNAIALESDILTLDQISLKESPIKSFDYDGKKYKKKEAKSLAINLKSELEEVNKQLLNHDKKIYSFIEERADKKSLNIRKFYSEFFKFDKEFLKESEIYNELWNAIQFINYTLPFDEIKNNIKIVKEIEERFKPILQDVITKNHYQEYLKIDIKSNIDQYLSEEYCYFEFQQYNDDELEILFRVLNDYNWLISKGYFQIKKDFLNAQADILKTTHNSKS
jgi:Zn-dependent protease with chaperone function